MSSKQAAFPAEWANHKKTILALEIPDDISDLQTAVANTRLVMVQGSLKWFVVNPTAKNLKGKSPTEFEEKHYTVVDLMTSAAERLRIAPRGRLASITPRTHDMFVKALNLYNARERSPTAAAHLKVDAFAARILARHAQCMASLHAPGAGVAEAADVGAAHCPQ